MELGVGPQDVVCDEYMGETQFLSRLGVIAYGGDVRFYLGLREDDSDLPVDAPFGEIPLKSPFVKGDFASLQHNFDYRRYSSPQSPMIW